MEVIAGAGHNTIDRSPDYVPLLAGRARKPSSAGRVARGRGFY